MIHHAKKIVFVLAVVAFAAGCSKKNDATVAATPPSTDTAAAAPAATPAAAPEPIVVTDVSKSLAESDAALRAKAYDKAVQTLLAVQRQKDLTAQQAQEAANRMRGLQANLAAAVAAGDPNARAAADQLRQANMHR
jgi:uncharacterized lipoprotein YajG